jgi:hypothetical protein
LKGTYVLPGSNATCIDCPSLCIDNCTRIETPFDGVTVRCSLFGISLFVSSILTAHAGSLAQDTMIPLCDLNATNSSRFFCVDPSGFLPLPRDNPLTTECLAECVCANGTQYGACAYHNVAPSGVPQVGTPWCTVVNPNCLDSQNARPIPSGQADGLFRGSCVEANTFVSSEHDLVQTSVSATGVPDWQEIDLIVYPTRVMLVRPLIAPFSNGTERNGTISDMFLDYEWCYFNPAVVPTSVDREWACELLLAPRTSVATTIGTAMLDFPLKAISYGVQVNRKIFVNSIQFRSDNLDRFWVFIGSTGGGNSTGRDRHCVLS